MFQTIKRTHKAMHADDVVKDEVDKEVKDEVDKEVKDEVLAAEAVIEPVAKKGRPTPQPQHQHPLDHESFEIKVGKDFKGDETVQFLEGKRTAQFQLAPLTVKFSDLGPNGNLGTKFVPETAVMQAKHVVTLKRGASDKVMAAIPNIEKQQDDCFKKLNSVARDMLEMAWDKNLVLIKGKRKECLAAAKREGADDFQARAKQIYLEGATLPAKDYIDNDGDTEKVVKMSRKVKYRSRDNDELVDNRPIFWQRNRDGKYDNITESIRYMPRESVLLTQGQLRMYCMSAHYGVAVDMGKHIIVVWQAPRNGGGRKDPLADMTFIED